jgi:hypothetical protein
MISNRDEKSIVIFKVFKDTSDLISVGLLPFNYETLVMKNINSKQITDYFSRLTRGYAQTVPLHAHFGIAAHAVEVLALAQAGGLTI